MRELIKKCYANDVFRYVFFGGCTTMLNLVCFLELRKVGVPLNTANLISIILAILFAYVVNSRYVFQDHRETLLDHFSPFLKFIGARLSTMFIELGGVWLFSGTLAWPDWLGKGITQVMVLILNYVFSKFVVFNHAKKQVGK